MDVTISSSELEHLRQIEKRFPCDKGCNTVLGPAEDCSRHGRPPIELWDNLNELTNEVQRLQDTLEVVRELIAEWGRPEMVRALINEFEASHARYYGWEWRSGFMRGLQQAAASLRTILDYQRVGVHDDDD